MNLVNHNALLKYSLNACLVYLLHQCLILLCSHFVFEINLIDKAKGRLYYLIALTFIYMSEVVIYKFLQVI